MAFQDGRFKLLLNMRVNTGKKRWRLVGWLGLMVVGPVLTGLAITVRADAGSDRAASAQPRPVAERTGIMVPAPPNPSMLGLAWGTELTRAPAESKALGSGPVLSPPSPFARSAGGMAASAQGVGSPSASQVARKVDADSEAVPASDRETVVLPARALMLTDDAIVIHELPQPVAMPINDRLYPSHSLAIEITDLAGACYIQAESGLVQVNGRALKIGQPCLVQPGAVVTWSEDSGIRFSPGTHPGNVPANG